MTARARAPRVADLNWADTLPDNFESSFDAAWTQAVSEFTRAAGRTDGTRSALIAKWTAEFERVAS